MLSLKLDLPKADFHLKLEEELPLAGITAVFGPSGAGKSTLLRAIAGLETPAAGYIRFGDETWFDSAAQNSLPAHHRPTGYMFQDARLFAHLNVAGNLKFAEKRSFDGKAIGFEDVVAALDLSPLLDRRVQGLSGGEAQRVALGRTLLRSPRLLLLDEPLSALDRQSKVAILPYLEALPRQFGIPTLYVSHAIDEVARLADDVLVLSKGRALAFGPTVNTLDALDLEPITGRFEAGVLIEARVTGHAPEVYLTHIQVGNHSLAMPLLERLQIGAVVRLRVRARDVALATTRPENISIRNILAARITAIDAAAGSAFVDVALDAGTMPLKARITQAAIADLQLREGMDVFALIKSVSFDRRMM